MENFSEVTKIKIKILEEGVKFEPISLFSEVIKKVKFKNKTIFKKPISDGKEVYDYSSRQEIIPSEILLDDTKNESIVKCRYNPNSSIELKWKDDKLEILKNYLFTILPFMANYGDSKNAIKGRTLNATSLTNLYIPLPSFEEQKYIVIKVKDLRKLVDTLN